MENEKIMRTDYKKIFHDIVNKVDWTTYNQDLNRGWLEPMNERDYELIFTGFRLMRNTLDQISWEKLQKEIPITDEELKYYENLKTTPKTP